MTEMSIEEAYGILGVPQDADEVTMKKAYYALSKEAHPDTGTGDSERQSKLNEAFYVASPIALGRDLIVARQVGQTIRQFQKTAITDRASRQAVDAAQSTKRRRLFRARKIKNASFILALITALTSAFLDNLYEPFVDLFFSGSETDPDSPFNEDFAPDFYVTELRFSFGVFSFLCASLAAILQLWPQRIEYSIDVYMDFLDDLTNCAYELSSLLRGRPEKMIYESNSSTDEWDSMPSVLREFIIPVFVVMRRIFNHFEQRVLFFIPKEDQKRLLILKSVQHGLLEPLAPNEGFTPTKEMRYEIKYDPDEFDEYGEFHIVDKSILVNIIFGYTGRYGAAMGLLFMASLMFLALAESFGLVVYRYLSVMFLIIAMEAALVCLPLAALLAFKIIIRFLVRKGF